MSGLKDHLLLRLRTKEPSQGCVHLRDLLSSVDGQNCQSLTLKVALQLVKC